MGKGKCEKLCMFDHALKTLLFCKFCVILRLGVLYGISPTTGRKKNEKFELPLLASLS